MQATADFYAGWMDVELVQWPAEEERREQLRLAGVPRLLLVAADSPPPTVMDVSEDWMRLPAPAPDLRARVAALSGRAEAAQRRTPNLSEDGVLRYEGKWVALPPTEARLVGALLDRFGAVVGRDRLCQAGWPGGGSSRNALDVHMLRIRRRVGEVGLSVETIRSRGYLLQATDAGAAID